MRIFTSDFYKIMQELADLQKEGANHITYWNDGLPIRSCSDQSTFSRTYDAAEYCFEMSTDRDQMHYTAVVPIYRSMELALQSAILLKNSVPVIDLEALLRSYYRNELQDSTNTKNNLIMNEKNFDYLKDQVKYTGFGEALEGELRQNIEQQQPAFSLTHDAFYGDDKVAAELNFKKSDQTDLYFFNSYKVQLQKEDGPESLEQTFYINKGNNITLKEAYNLMEGRAVNKDLTSREGEVYNCWVQLDCKDADSNGNFRLNHYHEKYGYNLESALAKHPIKELDNPSHKEELMNSLKKGNLQSATFIKDGQEVKHYIEANPQFKTLTVYDANRQRLDVKQGKDQKQLQEQGQSTKQSAREQKNARDDDAPGETKQKQHRRKSQSL